MRIIDNSAALARALDQPLDPDLRALLVLRRDQLGGDMEDAARFLVVEPPDTLNDVEAAVGFPLVMDAAPTWEWAESHGGGWTEVVFVLSDDGPADVLLVPDTAGVDPDLTDLLRRHILDVPEVKRTTTA